MWISGLAAARKAAGLSQKSLAMKIGVSVGAIGLVEAGRGKIPVLLALMKALDLRVRNVALGKTLGHQVAARRTAHKVTIALASRNTGLSRLAISAIEKNEGQVADLIALLAVIAPEARIAPKNEGPSPSEVDADSRFTPQWLLDALVTVFGVICLDPCGNVRSPVSALRRILLSEGGNGLLEPWVGRFVFVNPPFSKLKLWVAHAHQEWRSGRPKCVVLLMPGTTSDAYFQREAWPDAHVFLIEGRLAFGMPNGRSQDSQYHMIMVVFGSTIWQRARLAKVVPGNWIKRVAASSIVDGLLKLHDIGEMTVDPLARPRAAVLRRVRAMGSSTETDRMRSRG